MGGRAKSVHHHSDDTMMLVTGPHFQQQGARTPLKKIVWPRDRFPACCRQSKEVRVDTGSEGHGTSENGHLRLARWGKSGAGCQRTWRLGGSFLPSGDSAEGQFYSRGPSVCASIHPSGDSNAKA